MERLVITIARHFGSGGRTVGMMLAKELGIQCYDREILRMASDASGINETLFEKADERLKSNIFRISSKVYNTPSSWYTRTGRLRNSITHKTEDESHGVDIIVGTNVEYAPYVELGTGLLAEKGDGRKTPWTDLGSDGKFHTTTGMSPRPFLRPSVENYGDEYKEVVKKALEGS